MGMYKIIAANEVNPDLLAKAYADLYMGRIMKSPCPEKAYQAVIKALEEECEREKQQKQAAI